MGSTHNYLGVNSTDKRYQEHILSPYLLLIMFNTFWRYFWNISLLNRLPLYELSHIYDLSITLWFCFLYEVTDYCLAKRHNCHPNATCTKEDDYFKCNCKNGLNFYGNGTYCFGEYSSMLIVVFPIPGFPEWDICETTIRDLHDLFVL